MKHALMDCPKLRTARQKLREKIGQRFNSRSFRVAFFGGEPPLPVAGLFVLCFGCGAFFSFSSLVSESIWIAGELERYSRGGGEEGGGVGALGA